MNRDGTGPQGQGSRTGGGMGTCPASSRNKMINLIKNIGRGMGRGFDRGRGFAWRARAMQAVPMQAVPMQQVQPTVITEKEEKQFLGQELDALKEEMKEIEKRLKELKE